ncbi:hypothetical protein [Tunturiibacter gelidiferens]|uniref:hypothetical protein n=1 Tax=Tunturiibacter gelidiferens TaxID=3069689 RepID=UPI003D9B8250
MLPILRSSRARYIFAVIFASSLFPSLHAQSTEADIKAKLKDKPLYLRGFWREDDLHFDSTGQLIGKSGTVTFTICGFGLKAIDLKLDKLILDGTRVGLELSGDRKKRVSLNKHMHIEIAASPNGDYGPALDAIFADGLDRLVPSLHTYWKSYAEKNFLPASVTPPMATPANSDSTLGDTKVKKLAAQSARRNFLVMLNQKSMK